MFMVPWRKKLDDLPKAKSFKKYYYIEVDKVLYFEGKCT
jgi:hypothetical protein